jgi:hypothetical protein
MENNVYIVIVNNSINIRKTNNKLSLQIKVNKEDHEYSVRIPGPG